MFNYITRFNDWVASQWPGAKTKVFAWLVGLPSALMVVLQMFGDINFDWKLFIGDYAPYAGVVVSAMIYWLRVLTNRTVVTETPATTTVVSGA